VEVLEAGMASVGAAQAELERHREAVARQIDEQIAAVQQMVTGALAQRKAELLRALAAEHAPRKACLDAQHAGLARRQVRLSA
jgi:hypothetical protein